LAAGLDIPPDANLERVAAIFPRHVVPDYYGVFAKRHGGNAILGQISGKKLSKLFGGDKLALGQEGSVECQPSLDQT
jgi:hypothetical protein